MNGERDLWCAVVRVAVEDARKGEECAVNWFRRGGQDYRYVCHLAGVEPELVRATMLAELPPDKKPQADSLDLLARLRKLQGMAA